MLVQQRSQITEYLQYFLQVMEHPQEHVHILLQDCSLALITITIVEAT